MDTNNKITAIESTANKLKELILSGTYNIGDKLPTEKEFCEDFNVGRSTIREALGMLKAMGLISIQHGKGTFVERNHEDSSENIVQWFIKNEHELNDFMEVRCSIEILNIKYAVLRRSDEDVRQLELTHNRFENAIMRNDITKMATLDEAFHLEIAKMTRNSLLIDFNNHIAKTLRPYRLRSFALQSTAYNAVLPHRHILQAIKDQELEKGIEFMKEHIDISLQDISYIISGKASEKANCASRKAEFRTC